MHGLPFFIKQRLAMNNLLFCDAELVPPCVLNHSFLTEKEKAE
jgi:hypothetical protein